MYDCKRLTETTCVWEAERFFCKVSVCMEYRVDGSRPISALVADVTHVTSWFEPKRQTADP